MHKRVDYTIFVGNSLIGQYAVLEFMIPLEDRMPAVIGRSRAYFCPECGDIWARILAEGYPFTHPILRRCFKHFSDRHQSAGSLILHQDINYGTFDDPHLEAFPPELWHYELQVLVLEDKWWYQSPIDNPLYIQEAA